jgi:hypothetical protein
MTINLEHVSRTAAVTTALAVLALAGASVGGADSTPIGALPKGPVTTTSTKPGQLIAVALPRARQGSGLVWRVARRYDARVVRQVSEADVGASVVLVYKAVGRGNTSLVFGLTRGDGSPRAVKAATYRVHSG